MTIVVLQITIIIVVLASVGMIKNSFEKKKSTPITRITNHNIFTSSSFFLSSDHSYTHYNKSTTILLVIRECGFIGIMTPVTYTLVQLLP